MAAAMVGLAALTAFLTLFDWNALREPAQRYASRSLGRAVSIGSIDVRPSVRSTIVLTDVTIADADWSGSKPMTRAGRIEFDLSLPSLLSREIVIPRLRLTDADVALVRTADGRANWKLERNEEKRRSVAIRTLSLERAAVSYRDALLELTGQLNGSTREDGVYQTRLRVSGQWRKTAITGTADTGGAISLRGSPEPFPIRLTLQIGSTAISAEGRVADITRLQHIDTTFTISGPSLATLYPTLRLTLPATPPYRFTGRLRRDGDDYAYEGFNGTIGSTDIGGEARYELREPRPLLTARLKSRRLDLADLGPLVGLGPAKTGSASTKTSAASTRPADPVLPQGNFNLQKLNAMDADVHLTATSLRIPEQLPLENFATQISARGGVLTLDPLHFGMAGGSIVSTITLDARNDPITGRLGLDLRRVRLSELFPTVERMKQSGGRIGAHIRLAGRGNSVADLLSSSNGTVLAGMAGGRISELSVWMVNLHGGELLRLLFGGDRPTRIRCGALAMQVKDGIGTVESFVFDTDESRLDGAGHVDLRNERFRAVLRPEPKKPGLLSLRGAVHIRGSFSDADFGIAPESIARGMGAVGLGIVNPLLALIPLIETGPGEDADCREVLTPVRSAIRQAGSKIDDAPAARGRRKRQPPAPIIDLPPNPAQPQAPIIDAAPK